jgi:hypothetical protein
LPEGERGMIARAYRLDVTRLAADYSQSVRETLTESQLINVRSGDAVAADYVDTGELLAEAVALQVPGFESLADYGDEITEASDRAEAAGFRLSRVLVACEFSGTVRQAFEAAGHAAESCDILPSEAPGGIHHQRDVREILGDGYHLMVAHPPCTFLAACQLWRCQPKHDPSGQREAKRQEALQFVRDLAAAPIARAAIENPKGCIGTENAAPGFTPSKVQPYQFGHDHSKETYLWLRGLPALVPDPADYVEPRIVTKKNGRKAERWANQCDESGADTMGPSADRGHKRSRFFAGIARAMAEQWGGLPTRPKAPVLPIGQLELAL